MKKINLRQDEPASSGTETETETTAATTEPAESTTTTTAKTTETEGEADATTTTTTEEPAATTTTEEPAATTTTKTTEAEPTTTTTAKTTETEAETDTKTETEPATETKTEDKAETEAPKTTTATETTKTTETPADETKTTSTTLSAVTTTPASATITSSEAEADSEAKETEEEEKEAKIEKEVKKRLKTIHNVPRITKFGNTIETRDNVEYLRSIDPELVGFEKVYPEEHITPEEQDYYLRSDEKCFPEDMDYLVKATNKEVYEKIYWCYAGWQEWKVANYALWERTSTVYENVSMVRGEREVINDYILYDRENIQRVNVLITLLQEKLRLLKEDSQGEVQKQLQKANDLKHFIQKELDKNELAYERCEQFLAAYVEQMLLVDVLKDELLVNQQKKINMANRISNSAYYAKTETENKRFIVEMLVKFKKMLTTINNRTHNTLVETIKNVNFNKRQSQFIDDRVATRIAHRAIYEDRINPQFEELERYTQKL